MRRAPARAWALAATLAAGASGVRPVRAGEEAPHVSRAPTLPDLQHRDVKLALDTTAAAVGDASAAAHRVEVEVPISGKAWQLGAAWAFASAKLPRQPAVTLGGNAEVWARGEWVETRGLAFGGGFAFSLPTARHSPAGPGADAARVVVAARPWDATTFEGRVLSLRPFVDMRLSAGPFAVQLRHTVEFGVRAPEGTRAHVVGLIGLAATWRLGRVIPGVEAWELYYIERESADAARAFFTVAPFVCGAFGRLEPCLSVLTNVTRSVVAEAERVVAPRVSVAIEWD